MIYSKSILKRSSNFLDEKIEFGEMSRDMKGINIGMSMKDKNKKIPPKKAIITDVKTKVLRLDCMSQHCAQHVSPHHSSNKK